MVDDPKAMSDGSSTRTGTGQGRGDDQNMREQMRAANTVAEAQRAHVDTQAAVQKREHVKQAWDVLCIALGTDKTEIAKLNRQGAQRGLVNLAYLAVIMGCEIDLYGFAMAVGGYWSLKDQTFAKIMCILGPTGYLLAVFMYMYYGAQFQAKEQEKQRSQTGPQTAFASSVTPAPVGGTTQNFKQPIKLRYFHFLPVVRFYLVVKDKEIDDIEGVFRVNSLSSFSLGIAQICGIIFYGLENDGQLDLFTQINVGSQMINWLLTMLYFVTPISAKMGAAMKVEALIYNSGVRLRELWETYICLVVEHAEARRQDSQTTQHKLDSFQNNINREILVLSNVDDIDLTPFTMEEKFNTLKFLHRRMNNVYATI